MANYKSNFNTNLRFEKTLELLNKLTNHTIETDFQPGEGAYFIVEVNKETKDILCTLGVDTAKLGYYDEKDGMDIIEIWGEIIYQYGQEIAYSEGKFYTKDDEMKEALVWIENRCESLLNDSLEADKVNCHAQSIKSRIANVYPKCYRKGDNDE